MNNGKPPRRWWSVAGWNVLFMSLGAALIFIDWEAWFHLRAPFTEARLPTRFEPGVGLLYEPGAEARWTNHTSTSGSRNGPTAGGSWIANPRPRTRRRRLATSPSSAIPLWRRGKCRWRTNSKCGWKSYAARALPRLNITTSAYGRRRHRPDQSVAVLRLSTRVRLRPKLVVLVFFYNDFVRQPQAIGREYSRVGIRTSRRMLLRKRPRRA